MGAYDAHPRTFAWFEAALTAPNPVVRWRAVQLLEFVDSPPRRAWLARMQRDPDPRVASIAVMVAALVDAAPVSMDLMESDFATVAEGGSFADAQWEWEYRFAVCEGLYVPTSDLLVWVRREDDEVARHMALMKAAVGSDRPDRVAILTDKRFVNRYTRSPRTVEEAMRWGRSGRPRPAADW